MMDEKGSNTMKQLSSRQRNANKLNVYHTLKNAIQFLELKPGTQIVEADLSAELGVSRTPIREALMRLSDELLVEIYPQRGTYVSKIDLSLSKEMAYMRHVLETEIFSKLCEEKANIQDAVEDKLYLMSLALKRNDPIEYIRNDAEFHRAIFSYAGHEMIWNTISNTRAHYVRTLVLDMSLPNSLRKSYQAHKKIVQCIQNGDKDGLLELLEDHHDYKLTPMDEKIKAAYPDYFKD